MKLDKDNKNQKLVVLAILLAAGIILNRIVPATPVYHISFDFLAIITVGLLYGPIYAGITATMTDFIGAIILPFGVYNPGITLSIGLQGLAMGFVLNLFLKRAKRSASKASGLTIKALILPSVIIAVITGLIGLFLTSYFLWMMYGSGDTYFAYVLLRIPNALVTAGIKAIIIPPFINILLKRVIKLS